MSLDSFFIILVSLISFSIILVSLDSFSVICLSVVRFCYFEHICCISLVIILVCMDKWRCPCSREFQQRFGWWINSFWASFSISDLNWRFRWILAQKWSTVTKTGFLYFIGKRHLKKKNSTHIKTYMIFAYFLSMFYFDKFTLRCQWMHSPLKYSSFIEPMTSCFVMP